MRVQAEDFDPGREAEALAADSSGLGALAMFVGFCRNEDGALQALELEHYPGMAEAELETLVARAAGRWRLIGARIVHRFGVVPAGARIVFVATTANHRADAFAAAEFLMDHLKTQAPFWKREIHADGTIGAWIDAKRQDDAALARWEDDSVTRAGSSPAAPA